MTSSLVVGLFVSMYVDDFGLQSLSIGLLPKLPMVMIVL